MDPNAVPPAEARARAEQLQQLARENPDGLRDMQNLTLTMGLPLTRAVFRQMVAAAGKRGKAKRAALAEIEALSPLTEVGCVEVSYRAVATGAPGVAYLRLAACPRGHDLGAQLDKLRLCVSEDGWKTVLQHLSALVCLGRSIYRTVALQKLDLIRGLFGLAADDGCERYLSLQVDPANTTLYLDPAWPDRIGILVSLQSEADGEPA